MCGKRSRRTAPEGLSTGQHPCPIDHRHLRQVVERLFPVHLCRRRQTLPTRRGHTLRPWCFSGLRNTLSGVRHGHTICPRISQDVRKSRRGKMRGQGWCPMQFLHIRHSRVWTTAGQPPCPLPPQRQCRGQPPCPCSLLRERNCPQDEIVGQPPCPHVLRLRGRALPARVARYRVWMLMARPAPRATG